jgi:hypothetical protein
MQKFNLNGLRFGKSERYEVLSALVMTGRQAQDIANENFRKMWVIAPDKFNKYDRRSTRWYNWQYADSWGVLIPEGSGYTFILLDAVRCYDLNRALGVLLHTIYYHYWFLGNFTETRVSPSAKILKSLNLIGG